MPTEAKVREVEEFRQVLEGATSVVLTDFTGLDVAAVSDLRRKCRAAGVGYHVIKNSLARRAVQLVGLEEIEELLAGPNAWAVHKSDQVAPAKVLAEFGKTHPNLKIRGGIVDGRLVSTKEVEALAKLPSREVLLSQTLSVMQSPMTGFAGVLAAMLRGFANVVDALAKKRTESESAVDGAAAAPSSGD
jgi:large subunit ribosomal protein L10